VRDILVEVLEGGEKVLGCKQPTPFNFMKNTATYRRTLSSLLTGPKSGRKITFSIESPGDSKEPQSTIGESSSDSG
jgi:hypothetical protein